MEFMLRKEEKNQVKRMKSLLQINFPSVTLLCIFTAMLCIVISENTGSDHPHPQVLQ